MKENGLVTEINGNTAKIKLTSTPRCHQCGLCTSASGQSCILTIKTDKTLRLSQSVTIEIKQNLLTLSSLLLYGIPLVTFISGAILGYLLGKDILGTIMALVFAGDGLLLAKIIIKKINLEKRIARIADDELG